MKRGVDYIGVGVARSWWTAPAASFFRGAGRSPKTSAAVEFPGSVELAKSWPMRWRARCAKSTASRLPWASCSTWWTHPAGRRPALGLAYVHLHDHIRRAGDREPGKCTRSLVPPDEMPDDLRKSRARTGTLPSTFEPSSCFDLPQRGAYVPVRHLDGWQPTRKKENRMSDYIRSTRECPFDQLRPELARAIEEYAQIIVNWAMSKWKY